MSLGEVDPDAMTNRMVLPCGCVIGEHAEAFVIVPCSPTCEYYQYALEESARQGKPIAFSDDQEPV